MLLTHSQNIIAADLHRFRVLNCGRRFGKTTLAVEEIKGKVLYKPKRVAYIAPTYGQARDIAWEMLVNELSPIAVKMNESLLEMRLRTVKNEESVIKLRGWESIENLKGQKFDFVVIDEIALMRNFWLYWEEVIRPTLADTKGEGMFISTPKGFNHFYDLYNRQNEDKDFKSFHFTTYDNPFIPRDEIEKMRKEMTEDRFSQEILADFRKMQGLVYKEFDRDKHVFTVFSEHFKDSIVDRFVGIDWGHTNPAAVLHIQKDNDNHFWVTSEYYKTERSTEEIIEYAAGLRAPRYYPDPAEPDRIELMKKAGLNAREVSKDIEAGIDAVRELFKQGRLHIHSSCINLINELETYAYPDKKPDRNEPEIPIKEHDHALDALRYALYMQGNLQQNRAQINYGNLSPNINQSRIRKAQVNYTNTLRY